METRFILKIEDVLMDTLGKVNFNMEKNLHVFLVNIEVKNFILKDIAIIDKNVTVDKAIEVKNFFYVLLI